MVTICKSIPQSWDYQCICGCSHFQVEASTYALRCAGEDCRLWQFPAKWAPPNYFGFIWFWKGLAHLTTDNGLPGRRMGPNPSRAPQPIVMRSCSRAVQSPFLVQHASGTLRQGCSVPGVLCASPEGCFAAETLSAGRPTCNSTSPFMRTLETSDSLQSAAGAAAQCPISSLPPAAPGMICAQVGVLSCLENIIKELIRLGLAT